MRFSTRLMYPAALALLLGTGLAAQADLVHWSYNWARSPSQVLAGTGGVTLTDEPLNHVQGPSDIVATNLKTFSSADPLHPDHLSNAPYTLTLTLVDDASSATTTMTFTGKLDGDFSSGASHIQNFFTSPTTLSANLGGHTYTVTIGPYSPPGPPSASNSGSIAAHVDVNGTPEPSTVILGGLGLTFLGVFSWGKRRRGNAPVVAAV